MYHGNKDISTKAFYFRLIRKAFYSFKLYREHKTQSCKGHEISLLFMQRRFLRQWKQYVKLQQDRLKQKQDATIFHFLALQRKGLTALFNVAG